MAEGLLGREMLAIGGSGSHSVFEMAVACSREEELREGRRSHDFWFGVLSFGCDLNSKSNISSVSSAGLRCCLATGGAVLRLALPKPFGGQLRCRPPSPSRRLTGDKGLAAEPLWGLPLGARRGEDLLVRLFFGRRLGSSGICAP